MSERKVRLRYLYLDPWIDANALAVPQVLNKVRLAGRRLAKMLLIPWCFLFAVFRKLHTSLPHVDARS